jgi:hypothetical protein
MTVQTQQRDPDQHDCPGGCGARVPRWKFACKPCWFRLPREIREKISAQYRRDAAAHRAAMREAMVWYQDHGGAA